MCSFDARSEDSLGNSLSKRGEGSESWKQNALVGRAQREINRPPVLESENFRSFGWGSSEKAGGQVEACAGASRVHSRVTGGRCLT